MSNALVDTVTQFLILSASIDSEVTQTTSTSSSVRKPSFEATSSRDFSATASHWRYSNLLDRHLLIFFDHWKRQLTYVDPLKHSLHSEHRMFLLNSVGSFYCIP